MLSLLNPRIIARAARRHRQLELDETTFTLPLQPGDREPVINLGYLLHVLYDQASYDLRLDYGLEPPPPLAEEDVVWVEDILRQAGLG